MHRQRAGTVPALVVKEKVVRCGDHIPDTGALITNDTPVIAFKVTDDDSGINEKTIKLTVDDSAVASEEISEKAVSGGYECTYTPTKAHLPMESIRSR